MDALWLGAVGVGQNRSVSPDPLDALSPVPLGAGRATPRLRAAALVRLSSYSRLPCHAQGKRSRSKTAIVASAAEATHNSLHSTRGSKRKTG